MDVHASNTHSFIIKIWLEETAEESGRATWRGHITHVPSEERRYLKDLDGITAFIASYLKGMGVSFGRRRRIDDWIRQFGACLSRLLLG